MARERAGGTGAVTSVNGQTGVVVLGIDNLSDVVLTAPAVGEILTFNGADWVNTVNAGSTPAGLNTQVQFNNAGAFGASADLTWDDVGKEFFIDGKLTVTGILDPTMVLLSGADKRFSATDAGSIYLSPFTDSTSAIQVRRADDTTVVWNVDTVNSNVGIGTASPNTTALLDLTSTTQGFLGPRMTTVQRDAIAGAAAGLMIFNTDTNSYDVFGGTIWSPVADGSIGGTNTQVQFNDNGSFAGSSDFTWDDTSKILYVNGKMTLTGSLDPTDVMLTGGFQRIYGKVPTTADTVGENMFIDVDPGTGTAAGGSWEVRTADVGTVSGTTPNALYTRFKVHADGHSEFADAVITQYRNITDVPTGGVTMFQQNLNIDSPANTTEYISMGNATTIVPTGNTADYLNFQGAAYQFTHQGTGTIGLPLSSGNIGYSANISNESTGTIELAIPMLSLINNSDAGHIEDAIGFTNVLFNSGAGTIENVIGYNVNAPLINTGSINNVIGVNIADHSGIGLVKSFNIWSRGVNSFNIFDGKIGLGTVGPDASSIVDIVSTAGGFLGPRMTTAQRNAISSPATGLQIYNTTTNKLDYYDGTSWEEVGGTASVSVDREVFVATGGETVFNLSFSYVISSNKLLAFKNGLLSDITSDYTETSTTSVTYGVAAIAGDKYQFINLS